MRAARRRAEIEHAGRARTCPRCAAEFVSVLDRGACPGCGHVSYASKLRD